MKNLNFLSKIQNFLLLLIYKIKPKFFFYSYFDYFSNYPAYPEITGLKFSKSSKIAKKDDLIFLPNDAQLTWQLMKYGELNYFISRIIKRKLDKKEKYIFIDIGSNVGLVSRQLYLLNKNIDKFICVEPVKSTFNCLKINTSSLENFHIYNFGLGKKNKFHTIFIDKSNHGNASLEKTMMKLSKYKKFSKEQIEIKSVNSFFKIIQNKIKGRKLIIKIDTQSHDELIVSLIPKKILKSVELLIYEITSVKGVNKPKVLPQDFINRIKMFKNIWSEDLGNLEHERLLEFANNSDINMNLETDIFLSKN